MYIGEKKQKIPKNHTHMQQQQKQFQEVELLEQRLYAFNNPFIIKLMKINMSTVTKCALFPVFLELGILNLG